MHTLMTDTINITTPYQQEPLVVPLGTPVTEIFELLKPTLRTAPMNVVVNHCVRPLHIRLFQDCQLHFIDYTHEQGRRTYVRTLQLVISKAVQELALPNRETITFEHSISNGIYAVWGNPGNKPAPHEVKALNEKVLQIISNNTPIINQRVPLQQAIQTFTQQGRLTTVELLKNRGKCYVNCKVLGNFVDFVFGYTLPRTGMLWGFSITPYEKGLLLSFPNTQQPETLNPKPDQPKIFDAYQRHIQLLNTLGMEDVGPMNAHIKAGNGADFITISEALQEKQIARIAEEIARRHQQGVRIVLISGPSSSGKTTFSKRLQTQLMTNLIKPYTLSLDDFFVNRELTPLDEEGEYDYEHLHALDLPYLQQTLLNIIQGLEIDMPTFDFVSGARVFKNRKLHLELDQILIIEGTHGLNPELIQNLPEKSVFRIFVSALTTLSLDPHNYISSSDNRLLRRMVRDAKYRGISASATIQRWPSVRRGEERWIFPYQEQADAIFNSAMLYELSALRGQAEPLLSQVREIEPEYGEARRLLKLLQLFEPLSYEYMPPTSLLREFLGGSSYRY